MFCTKCGTELPDDSQFCRKCGHAFTAMPTTDTSTASSPTPANAPAVSSSTTTTANLGTFVFVGFALLSLVVSFVKGIVPIFLVESVLWGALAWYWHKKKPTSQVATAIVLLLAVAVAAGEGYLVGRHFGVKSYTYLQQGNAQYRVDNAAGRTDRLGTGGWEAVSFDRSPEPIQLSDLFWEMSMGKGEWGPKEVCFDVSNDSHYVLQDVTINVSFDPKPADDNIFTNIITLKRYSGAPLDKGKSAPFCSPAPRTVPSGSTWTYTLQSVTGWKE